MDKYLDIVKAIVWLFQVNIINTRGRVMHTAWMSDEQLSDHITNSRNDFTYTGDKKATYIMERVHHDVVCEYDSYIMPQCDNPEELVFPYDQYAIEVPHVDTDWDDIEF